MRLSFACLRVPMAKKSGKKAKDAAVQTDEAKQVPSKEKTSTRPLNMIVWGATGYTGKLLCQTLAERYPVCSLAPLLEPA